MNKQELENKVKELKELKVMAEELQAEITSIEDSIKAEMTNQNVNELQVGISKSDGLLLKVIDLILLHSRVNILTFITNLLGLLKVKGSLLHKNNFLTCLQAHTGMLNIFDNKSIIQNNKQGLKLITGILE